MPPHYSVKTDQPTTVQISGKFQGAENMVRLKCHYLKANSNSLKMLLLLGLFLGTAGRTAEGRAKLLREVYSLGRLKPLSCRTGRVKCWRSPFFMTNSSKMAFYTEVPKQAVHRCYDHSYLFYLWLSLVLLCPPVHPPPGLQLLPAPPNTALLSILVRH